MKRKFLILMILSMLFSMALPQIRAEKIDIDHNLLGPGPSNGKKWHTEVFEYYGDTDMSDYIEYSVGEWSGLLYYVSSYREGNVTYATYSGWLYQSSYGN